MICDFLNIFVVSKASVFLLLKKNFLFMSCVPPVVGVAHAKI